MRRLQFCLLLIFPWLLYVPRISAQETTPLDNNAVVQMVKWHLTDAEIIADMGRNQTNFDLSAATIKDLKGSGVSEAVIDAMFTAAKKSAESAAVAAPKRTALKDKPVSGTPTPPSEGTHAPAQLTPAPQAAVTPQPAVVIPAHSPDRLAKAIHTTATSLTLPPIDPSCPPDNNGKIPSHKMTLYFSSGTSDPSTVDDSGSTCFVVQGFNNILYTSSFALTETAPSDTAFADLQDAITKVTALSFGNVDATSQQKSQQKAQINKSLPATCPANLPATITTAQDAATQFGNALAAIDPGKDANGKVNLIDVATTVAKWQAVPPAYRQFEAAVSQLIAVLQQPDVDVCSNEWLSAAENIVLEVYSSPSGAQNEFASLQRLVDSDHNVRFTSRVHSTSSYTLTVTANSPQGTVANGSVTFSLAAGRKILSTSGGFLVTWVPNPSYASVTAPNGTTATQNVLAVNNPTGPTVGLVALVDVYLPNIHFGQHKLPLNGRGWGLAFSAGPSYNVSNGKADTTKFGLFAGPSLHIRSQFFLTPGFNLAQYSALPQGFTQAGQVIPPNSGTPTGIPRWTTRFALAFTYKIKDFGQSTTPSQVSGNQGGNPPNAAPAATPAPTPAKKKTGGGS
jgi:hypothetical protein